MSDSVIVIVSAFAFITNIVDGWEERKERGKEGKNRKKLPVIDWENTLLQPSRVFVIFMWVIIYIDMNYMINKAKRMREQSRHINFKSL